MGIVDLIRKLFGRTAPPPAPASPEPAPPPLPVAPEPVAPPDPAQRSADRRDQFWASVGLVEPDLLSHLVSPGLIGGPAWPTTRQAYRVVRRADGSTLIATDGLSDPFDDGGEEEEASAVNGFELELFAESADLPAGTAGAPGDIAPLAGSWLLELVRNVAGTVAQAGGIAGHLDRHGVLSMEIPGVSSSTAISAQLPARYVTADDALGILIGAPAPDFAASIEDMPLSPVRLVPIVLLTAAELGEIRAGDEETRDAIAARLAAMPSGHRSDLGRPSIV